MVLRLEVSRGTINSTVDGEEAVAVWKFDKLRNYDASETESHVHLPDWAGSAILGQVE